MAFTNSTTNYHLPQYISSDIPSYLVDQNDAWETIDNALGTITEDVQEVTAVSNSAMLKANEVDAKAVTADAKASGALNNEAEAFSTSKTYAIGDYVIYNNTLYECISAVTVAGAFDGMKWATRKITDVLKRVKRFKPGDEFYVGPASGFANSNSYVSMSVILPFPVDESVTSITVTGSTLRGNGNNYSDFTITDVSISDQTERTRVNWHCNADITRYHFYSHGGVRINFN